MTITEIINSFEKLSPEQQDKLLKILLQTRSQTRQTQNLANRKQLNTNSRKAEDEHQETFWQMTLRFRERMQQEGIEFSDEDFVNLRDKSSGREVEL